jgi:hypothetical protein
MQIRNWKCAVIVSLLFLALVACSKKAPTIEIEQIPIAIAGGPSRMDTISGRVRGNRRGQRLVLFARAGVWWIQPYAAQPFTTIGADGRWSTSTHLGTEYAALLVDPNYQPNDIENALPAVGNGVAAVATVEGRTSPAAAAEPLVSFSGYKWQVRDSETDRNGSVQLFKTANIRIDSSGFLHMMIVGAPPHWTCSEVMLTRSLGYGTYSFDVEDPSQLEPAAVLSLFTWTDADPDQHHREMDINLTRWGDPARKSAEFILQPYYLPQNVFRFTPPAGAAEYSMQWGPGLVSFRGRLLRDGTHSSFAEHNFSVGVPTPANEGIHLNFCAFGYSKVPLQHSSEVVVERFQFLP